MAESAVEILRAAAAEALVSGKIRDYWIRQPLADWLEGAALDAEEIGVDYRALKFARRFLETRDGV